MFAYKDFKVIIFQLKQLKRSACYLKAYVVGAGSDLRIMIVLAWRVQHKEKEKRNKYLCFAFNFCQ